MELVTTTVQMPLPLVRQPDTYSCGALAMMAVCMYYGVGPKTIEEFKTLLRTSPERGTDYRYMIQVAHTLGLEATATVGLTTEQLEAAITVGQPVIVALQAHVDDPAVYQDATNNQNGHYVVVIGQDQHNYYFEDPSVDTLRGYLPKADFLQRWHDDEGTITNPQVVDQLGIIFGPPKLSDPVQIQACRMA